MHRIHALARALAELRGAKGAMALPNFSDIEKAITTSGSVAEWLACWTQAQ